MIYFLDTANLEQIKYCNEFYPISGVTTNPTIISKENTDFWKLVKGIRAVIGDDKLLMVQTVQTEASKIIEEAKLLKAELGYNFVVKIPMCEEGLKATMALKALGIRVLITTIFTPPQALIAANAGASYVAPYISRSENLCADGVGTVADIAEIFAKSNLTSQILAASFKTAKEVLDVAVAGCHSATISPSIMRMLISHTTTDTSILGFERDWKAAFGDTTLLQLMKK